MRTKLADLSPSRDARLMAGVICGIRPQMTQRGKLWIIALDDKSAVVEITVFGEMYDENRHMFKEDEFLLVSGKVSEDRFTGGVRVSAEKAWDLAAARIAYGKKFGFYLPKRVDSAKLREVLTPHLREGGLPVAIRYRPQGAECEIVLGDAWRVAPGDELSTLVGTVLGAQAVAVEY